MMKKIRKQMQKRFVKVWLAILVLALLLLGGRAMFFSQGAPSLEEVLSRNQMDSSPDLSMLAASLLALSLATISVAKSYEILRRGRPMAAVVLPQVKVEQSKDAGNKELEELRQTLAGLQLENAELQSGLKGLKGEFRDVDKIEKMLRKSNISLSKECERLRSENEILMLKVNSMKIKTKKRGNGKAKRKAQVRVKSKRGKKKTRK